MFRNRKSQPTIEVTKLSSLIAEGVEIVGDVVIANGLRIDGLVDGNVRCRPDTRALLVVSDKGTVRGSVHVHDAVVNGTICGDLVVENFLELQSGARISGNIRYRQLRMECGATVDGRLERIVERTEERLLTSENVVALPRVAAQTAP